MPDKYVTEEMLDKALKENNKVIIDEISEVMNVMMDRIDERFTKIENEIIDLKKSHEKLLNTVDGFIKRLEDYEVESRARDVQLERLVAWAKDVSVKTGIPLPQL